MYSISGDHIRKTSTVCDIKLLELSYNLCIGPKKVACETQEEAEQVVAAATSRKGNTPHYDHSL